MTPKERQERWLAAAQALLEARLRRGGRGWLRVRSTSMRPLLQPGDEVLVAPVRSRAVAVGDVIVFRAGRDFIVHRVIGRHSAGHLLTAGDAARAPDPPVPSSQVLGAAVRVRGKDRAPRAPRALRSPLAGVALRLRLAARAFLARPWRRARALVGRWSA